MVLNIKRFNIFIFIAGLASFLLFLIYNQFVFLIFFLTFFIYYFMIMLKLLIDFKTIMSESANLRSFSSSIQKNFFKELNDLILFIKDSFYKDQLIEAFNLTFSKNISSEKFYKIVIENLGLIFKTPHVAFILYDPTIEKYSVTSSNGVFLNLLCCEDYSEISSLNSGVISRYEYAHIFKTDFPDLKNMGLIKLESHLDYKGYILFGYGAIEISSDFFQSTALSF